MRFIFPIRPNFSKFSLNIQPYDKMKCCGSIFLNQITIDWQLTRDFIAILLFTSILFR